LFTRLPSSFAELLVELAAADAADNLDVCVVAISFFAKSEHEDDGQLLFPRREEEDPLPSELRSPHAREIDRSAASERGGGGKGKVFVACLICSVAYCEALSCRATSVEVQENAWSRRADSLVGGHKAALKVDFIVFAEHEGKPRDHLPVVGDRSVLKLDESCGPLGQSDRNPTAKHTGLCSAKQFEGLAAGLQRGLPFFAISLQLDFVGRGSSSGWSSSTESAARVVRSRPSTTLARASLSSVSAGLIGPSTDIGP
jgi:hypothetical protein